MPNIIGLGADLTEIPAASSPRSSDTAGGSWNATSRKGDRVFTLLEQLPAIHFAGRFASKEAAMKALGTGHTQGVLWRDVEVVGDAPAGPPQLRLHGGAARRFAAMGGRSSLLTITHTDALAMAQVMILGE